MLLTIRCLRILYADFLFLVAPNSSHFYPVLAAAAAAAAATASTATALT